MGKGEMHSPPLLRGNAQDYAFAQPIAMGASVAKFIFSYGVGLEVGIEKYFGRTAFFDVMRSGR